MTTQTSKMVQIAGRQIAMNGALIQIETAAGAAWIPLKHALIDAHGTVFVAAWLASSTRALRDAVSTPPAFTFFARDWLYERTVQTEDGPERFEYSACYVIAEDGTGRRWTAPQVFWGHALGSDVAIARASKLAERMKAQTHDGASFDPEAAGWAPTTPCYGSRAYDADWRAEIARDVV